MAGLALCMMFQRKTDSSLKDLHWSEEEQMYCDANINEDGKQRITTNSPVLPHGWLFR